MQIFFKSGFSSCLTCRLDLWMCRTVLIRMTRYLNPCGFSRAVLPMVRRVHFQLSRWLKMMMFRNQILQIRSPSDLRIILYALHEQALHAPEDTCTCRDNEDQ